MITQIYSLYRQYSQYDFVDNHHRVVVAHAHPLTQAQLLLRPAIVLFDVMFFRVVVSPQSCLYLDVLRWGE